MGSGWEAASVVGPLVLAFVAMIVSGLVSASPVAIIFFQRLTRRIVTYIFPSWGSCYRLFLKDFPPGSLHQCHSACQHVNLHAAQFHEPTTCWEDSVGKVFNRAWPSIQKKDNTTRKPHYLPLLHDFIQTDYQTLTAFLLLTVKTCRTCDTADVKSLLDIRTYGNTVTVHFKAHPLAPANTSLTKFEIERIIDGYPPFYRSEFSIAQSGVNFRLKSPISDDHHENISRGAWVLAVGLSTGDGPVPSLYNMKQLRQPHASQYWKGTLVMSAFEMVGHTLRKLRDYESSRSVRDKQRNNARWNGSLGDHAISCYELMMGSSWSSKPWILKLQELESQILFESLVGQCPCTTTCLGTANHSETCGRGQVVRKDAARKLTLRQCEAALEIFNNYSHSRENLEMIFPVLREVLQTVILGMCEVEHYFSEMGQHVVLPEILKSSKYIYLRTCIPDSE